MEIFVDRLFVIEALRDLEFVLNIYRSLKIRVSFYLLESKWDVSLRTEKSSSILSFP